MSITRTSIGKFHFDNCLTNAAGVHCQEKAELIELNQSSAGSFVTKTATLSPREGNPSPRYKNTELGSINSMGLPNHGIEYYLDVLSELEQVHPSKTYFLSLVGMTEQDTLSLVKRVEQSSFRGLIELNLSCPNVVGKPQVAYDFVTTKRILTEVFSLITKPLGIKLPPYFDLVYFDQAADIFNQFPLSYVNCINSVGNALIIEDEQVLIKPKNGFGGLGGTYIKPTALANVHAFYQRLNANIRIIGTGGVANGRDAFEHILCGASMVQLGTILQKEGIGVFSRITQELQQIMQNKGYQSIEDFRGKLRYL